MRRSIQVSFSLLLVLGLYATSEAKSGVTKKAAGLNSIVREVPTTFCNPLNLDYAYAPCNAVHTYSKNNSHRSTADPVCVMYKDKYYLFSTNQEGYWVSDDMASWKFISHKFKMNKSGDDVCAPAAWPTDRGLLFLPCFTETDKMPLYVSTDPASGKWNEAIDAFPFQAWDPTIFQDDDKRVYVFWGSSNVYPIYGVELDPDNKYKPKGERVEMLKLHPKEHGWEQFGEDNQNGKMEPFMEGAWVNKFNGKYYLQYGAPGTEWNVYGDGVYVSDHPLGPYQYQAHNPFSWKPTGFIRGAGHGATFADRYGNDWHVATMVVGIKHLFERRIGLFPAGVDKDGVLFANTAFGDYPQHLAKSKVDPFKSFTGWMLLSYNKKVWADQSNSNSKIADPKLAVDENIKTYWSAPDGKPGHFLAIDLGAPVNVRAIQINYADEQAQAAGKQFNVHHRYKLLQSMDGKKWELLVDKSENDKEVPHEYLELTKPVRTRFLKVENVAMPSGAFAIGDLRVFGNAPGAAPQAVSGFEAVRDKDDRRLVKLEWKPVSHAYAYNVSLGVAADKLYTSFLVYDKNNYELRALNTASPYFFQISAVSESGVSKPSSIVKVD